MLFNVPQQARTTLSHLRFMVLAPFVALVLIWWAFIPSAWQLAIELQHAQPRLAKDLRKSTWPVDTIALLFSLSLSPIWEKEFLVPSMALNTANAFDIACLLDRNDTLDEVPQNKKQKIATGLLMDKLHKQDFAGPLSGRASRALGPISRYRVADILLHMKLVSRASRPGLLVGFLHILCNGLCTAQRFHTEEHDHTCRVGCPNEPDSLTHYIECPRLYDIFVSFRRHATILPQRNHLLHDLVTRLFLQSLQYGIVVLGFLDAFVYAHHKHRHGSENPGNFGDCMKGRIRFMTTISPTYAHAYQATCLAQHFPGVPHHSFRLPKPKSRYPYLPNDRSITRARGNDYRGWAIYTDGGTRVVDGETLAGWCVISRSLHGRVDVMFGPVVTTEAHLAFSGGRTLSNNTAEMTAMIEALSFLGLHGPVARDEQSCIYDDSLHAAGICLGTIQARTHLQLALACQQSMIFAQRKLRLTMQHVYVHSGNLGNDCADHAAALVTLGFTSNHNVATRWIHHSFDASACFDGCNNITEILERLQRIRTDTASLSQNRS